MSGAIILAYETNLSNSCNQESLANRCVMMGTDAVSFTGWSSSTYPIAIANITHQQLWTLTIAVSPTPEAVAPELPAPVPNELTALPEPIDILPAPSPPPCSPIALSLPSDGRYKTSAALDLSAAAENSSCSALLGYSNVYSIEGAGKVLVIDVCTQTDWIPNVEASISGLADPCGGSCVSSGEVAFDINVCNSSFSGRFVQLRFLASRGTSYILRVSSPIAPEAPAFQISIDSVSPATNYQCSNATYLGTATPAVVAGSTAIGGLLSNECEISTNLGTSELSKRALWYKVVGSGGILRADACGLRTDFAARILVFEANGLDESGSACNFLQTCVARVDCAFSENGAEFSAREGGVYFIVVTGATFADAGIFDMTIGATYSELSAGNPSVRTPEPSDDSSNLAGAGADMALVVGHATNRRDSIFSVLAFPFPVRDPSSAVPSSIYFARLLLFGYGATNSSSTRIALRALNQSFFEATANTITEGMFGQVIDQADMIGAPGMYMFDLAAYLMEQQAAGNSMIYLALVDTHSSRDLDAEFHRVSFYSREHPNPLKRPRLVVQFHTTEPIGVLRVADEGDAFVQSAPSLVSKNRGAEEFLRVEDGINWHDESISYLMFTLPDDLPTDPTFVDRAELRLWGSCTLDSGRGMFVDARSAGSLMWNEKTLVFRNVAFASSGRSLDQSIVLSAPDGYYALNVIGAVKDAIRNGEHRVTISLTAHAFSSSVANFHSRESSIQTRKPILLIFLK